MVKGHHRPPKQSEISLILGVNKWVLNNSHISLRTYKKELARYITIIYNIT
jgi:hypothetical protein